MMKMRSCICITILVVSFLFALSSQGMLANGPKSGGILKAAMIGEPPTLDWGVSTANLTGTIAQHMFETLLSFDSKNIPQPMLAESFAATKDGLQYTITLRKGVLFHNGKEMTSEDVVASLNRWARLSSRGKIAAGYISSIAADGKYVVKVVLKKPFSPLAAFLALDNAAAGIYPKEVVERAGDKPLAEFIGTGPYMFVEWAPDRYVKLKRFDRYSADSNPADGNAGKRVAYVDEISFIPVPDASARLAGLQSGGYQYAEALSYDSYDVLKGDPKLAPIIAKPFLAPMVFFNTKEGIMKNQLMRQAFLAALSMDEIMTAAYSVPDFFGLGPNFYAKKTVFGSDSGRNVYNQKNPKKAKELLKKAGYNNEPIRWLATKEYEYIYNVSVVAVSQLRKAGFNIDLQIYDWATVIDRRAKPNMWEIFVTGHGFVPDPSLLTFMSPSYPGWWENGTKDKLFATYCNTTDPKDRGKVWSEIQKLVWTELPVVRFGEGFGLAGGSSRLKKCTGRLQTFFWNTWLEQ